MAGKRERQILTEFLELYKELTCLWDVESDLYRNKNRRNQAWDILADKLREFEPKATVMAAKRKVDCLRTAYKREARRESQEGEKLCGKPKTGYISKPIRKPDSKDLERNKLNIYETARELLRYDRKHNPFGLYVGEQLEQVTTFQRHVAEKIISEIIFLAKTKRLTFGSKIETPFKSGEVLFTNSNVSRSRSPSPHYI